MRSILPFRRPRPAARSTEPNRPPYRLPLRPAALAVRRHLGIITLLLAGTVPRVLALIAYRPAFWVGHDSAVYLDAARSGVPDSNWPYGYSAFLRGLSLTGRTGVVPVVQHAMGLAVAVLVYALLLRRGLPRWLATIGTAPFVLDAMQIALEHYILAETLFTTFVVIALVALLWWVRPPVPVCAANGAVLACAGLTRTVGLTLGGFVLLYLIGRRLGWLRVMAFTVALALPTGAYMIWYHHEHGVYATSQFVGRFLWARSTTFVDCGRRDLTDRDRRICPREPLGQRALPDEYLWDLSDGALRNRYPGDVNDPVYAEFAGKAIFGQPLDYTRTVLVDTGHFFQPGWGPPARTACVATRWDMPSGPQPAAGCRPALAAKGFRSPPWKSAGLTETALTRLLRNYSRYVTLPPIALLLGVLSVLATACWRPRRRWSDIRDAILLACLGLGMVVVAMAISAIDVRYGMPALPLISVAVTMCLYRLRADPHDQARIGAAAEDPDRWRLGPNPSTTQRPLPQLVPPLDRLAMAVRWCGGHRLMSIIGRFL